MQFAMPQPHGPSCIEHITEALTFDGVASVEVKLDEGAVAVEHQARISAGRLIAALEQAGFEERGARSR